jgi:hypothetical protein
MLTLLGSGQGQSGTYVELMLQAYKLRVYAEAGVFEAEDCLKASLKTLDGYQVDPNAQIVRDYSTRVRADGGTVEAFESTITSIKNLNNSDLYDKASLSLFSSGAKAGKAYSILPTNETGDFDVIRSTTKTRTNGAGLIETVAANVPSLNYDTVGGAPSILLEPQRTNLITYSQDASNSNWTKNAAIIVSNTTNAPDNTLTAFKLIGDTSGNVIHSIRQTPTFTPNTSPVITLHAKLSDLQYIYVGGLGRNPNNLEGYVWFDLQNGTVGTALSGYSGNIVSLINGWFKITVFCPISTVSANREMRIGVSDANGGQNYTGDGIKGVFIWGIQLEEGSFATSYIPTLGSAVTRNQDLVRKTAIRDLIGQTEGVFQIETSVFESSVQGIALSDGTSNNRLIIFYWSGTNSLTMSVNSQSSNSLSAFYTGSDVKKIHKIAVRYKNNDFSLWVDGALVVQSNFVTDWSAPLSRIGFDSGFGTSTFNGKAKSVMLFKTYLSNDEMILLNTP